MAYDVEQLLDKSDTELDNLFRRSKAGSIPNGPAEGTAIAANDTKLAGVISRLVNHFVWQGKTFDAKRGTLRNRVGIFGSDAIVAQVSLDASLLDGEECIIFDYSKPPDVAEHVRDEIREVAPGTYLGRVYWKQKPSLHFALQFGG
jgi:hypothetical protein